MLTLVSKFKTNLVDQYDFRYSEKSEAIELSLLERIINIGLAAFAALATVFTFGFGGWRRATCEICAQIWTGKVYREDINPFIEEEMETPLEKGEVVLDRVATLGLKKEITLDDKKVQPVSPPINLESKEFQTMFQEAPKFSGYKISLPKDHPCVGVTLTGVSLRPSNFFFDELFKKSGIETTLPRSGQLFAFNKSHDKIREYCIKKAQHVGVVAFSAQGKAGQAVGKSRKFVDVGDLGEIFGKNTYRMSVQEILNILESQKVYTSSLLPLPFYCGLKKAMKEDEIVVLPGHDNSPVLLKELSEGKHMGAFLAAVNKDPIAFGFTSIKAYQWLLGMTIYQIGSMVVKSEDYQVFIDGKGKIIEREVGSKDTIRLINACGIRGIHSSRTSKKYNQRVMTETFKTALTAAKDGFVVFPAVGMGVWRGEPALYWRAFFDAVVSVENDLERIFVNPRHQPSVSGEYKGFKGEEFQKILDEYKLLYKEDGKALDKLNKIFNLFDSEKDVVQLSHSLKKTFPDKTVSLFNASDPDVTLGYHVGEYVNNCPHTFTTEENYTAMGTNGLCFEGITGVHESPSRLIQT